MERRLATIMAMDVVGFTRLMERDEPGTLALLTEYWKRLEPLLAACQGDRVKTMGDGVLAFFPSVEGAVGCAVEVLRALAALEDARGAPEGDRMTLRIALNVGDLMFEGAEVYGEAVNVASRLQEVGAPGAVVLTRSVRDHLPESLRNGLADLGFASLKNVTRPVRVFQLSVDAGPERREADAARARKGLDRQARAHQAETAATVADPELGGYTRRMMAHYEDAFLCVRPTFRGDGGLVVYRMMIEWSEALPGLAFFDQNPGYEQRGRIAAPLGAPFLHFLTMDQGSARLMTAQQMPRSHHHMLGLALTLANPTGRALYPAATPVLLARIAQYGEALGEVAGVVDRADPRLADLPLGSLEAVGAPLIMDC